MTRIKTIAVLCISLNYIFLTGCASLQNVYPRTQIQAPMERTDYCILETVRGISETRSYMFGMLKVINNKAIVNTDQKKNTVVMNTQFSKFLGIGEEPNRYAYVQNPSGGLLGLFNSPTTEDRAYFNALSVLPEEADSVLNKSYYKEIIRHVPLLYRHEVTEFKGKAIRLKSDLDLRNNVSCVRIKNSNT